MSKTHELKTWPSYFDAVITGNKSFELRKNDRDFQVGDVLELKEYNPETETFSLRSIKVVVSYILFLGAYLNIETDLVIISFKRMGL